MKVLVTIPEAVAGRLDALAGHDVVFGPVGSAADAQALLCDPVQRISAAGIAAMPALSIVSVAGSGTDGLDAHAVQQRGLTVITAGEVLVDATADLAFGLIIGASRQLWDAGVLLREGGWSGWSFDQVYGREVSGSTLGLVGFGHIGRAVARRAAGFGMDVLHHTRRPTHESGWTPDLDTLLQRSDIVSLHLPLTPESRHLLDRRRLELLGPAGVLVNTSRGALLDEDALADCLERGRLLAAGLDVFDHEPDINPRLLAAPRTLMVPHIGSATPRTRALMLEAAARKLAEILPRGD